MKEINVQPNSRYQLKIDVSNTIDTSLIAQAGFIVWGEDGLFTSEPLIQLEGLIGNFDGTHTLSFTTDAATNNIVLQVFMMLNDSTQNNLYFTINNVTLEEVNGGEIYTINPHSSLNKYRFGFNGMESINEMYGYKGVYDFGARMVDPRLGRVITPDKFTSQFPAWSPYTLSANNPIYFIDRDGNMWGPNEWAEFAIESYHLQQKNPTWSAARISLTAYWHVVRGIAHTSLDALGLVPIIGELADGTNALIYVAEGDLKNAALSGVSMVPVIGDAAGKGTKYAIKAAEYFKVGERIFQSSKQAAKYEGYFNKYGTKVANAIWDAGRSGNNKLATALGTTLEKAHHIIPTELIEKSPLVREAIEQGFEFNTKANGIALDAVRHPGSHGSYTKQVEELINSISSNKKYSNLTSKQKLEKAIDIAKGKIETTTGKINEIKF